MPAENLLQLKGYGCGTNFVLFDRKALTLMMVLIAKTENQEEGLRRLFNSPPPFFSLPLSLLFSVVYAFGFRFFFI